MSGRRFQFKIEIFHYSPVLKRTSNHSHLIRRTYWKFETLLAKSHPSTWDILSFYSNMSWSHRCIGHLIRNTLNFTVDTIPLATNFGYILYIGMAFILKSSAFKKTAKAQCKVGFSFNSEFLESAWKQNP